MPLGVASATAVATQMTVHRFVRCAHQFAAHRWSSARVERRTRHCRAQRASSEL